VIGPFLLGVVVLAIAEVYAIVLVAHAIGLLLTLVLLLASSLLGVRLVRREGSRAFLAVRAAVSQGRPPAAEVVDGGLVLVGGVLLVIPGFVTDVIGLFLLLPTRRLVRPLVMRRLHLRAARTPGKTPTKAARHETAPRPGSTGAGRVIDGEVLAEQVVEEPEH